MKKLLTYIFILCCSVLKAQTEDPIAQDSNITPASVENSNYKVLWKSYFTPGPIENKISFQHPPAYSFASHTNHVSGLFCKIEYKLETKSKLAPRFRLGSVNYTNWMEGKGEWYSRYWK